MSTHDHPSGAGPGPDDGAVVSQETSLIPEKDHPVYSRNTIPRSEPGPEPSRKHRVPSSEPNTEHTSKGNTLFSSSAESKHQSVNLQSPCDTLPVTGEDGKKRIMKLPLQQVVSSGSRQPRSRHSRSEGTTPPKDKIEELLEENRKPKESLEKEHSVMPQASSDESISPLMVQQLRDQIISMQKELQTLQQEKREESEEKGKFEALYNDEKWKKKEIEKKAKQSKAEIAELEHLVYLVCTGAKLSSEQNSLLLSVYTKQVAKGLDEPAGPTEQEVPDLDEDLLAEDVSPPSLSQQQQQIPLSQDEDSDMQTLCRYLQSLTNTGKGKKKVCNVCFKEKPIDSHIITESLLEEACGDRECRSIILVDLERNSLTISTPTGWVEKLECGPCDRSTSKLEGEFVKRFKNTYTPSTELHREDALLFLLYGYRVLSMRDVFKYAVNDKLASYKELETFMVQVWTIRRALLHGTKINFAATNRILFHVFTPSETGASNYRITLTLCNVHLTDVDPDLGWCPLIYAKALHCCWAVLLGEHKAANIQKHFPRMISRIDHELSQEKIEPRGIVRKNSLKIKV